MVLTLTSQMSRGCDSPSTTSELLSVTVYSGLQDISSKWCLSPSASVALTLPLTSWHVAIFLTKRKFFSYLYLLQEKRGKNSYAYNSDIEKFQYIRMFQVLHLVFKLLLVKRSHNKFARICQYLYIWNFCNYLSSPYSKLRFELEWEHLSTGSKVFLEFLFLLQNHLLQLLFSVLLISFVFKFLKSVYSILDTEFTLQKGFYR